MHDSHDYCSNFPFIVTKGVLLKNINVQRLCIYAYFVRILLFMKSIWNGKNNIEHKLNIKERKSKMCLCALKTCV